MIKDTWARRIENSPFLQVMTMLSYGCILAGLIWLLG